MEIDGKNPLECIICNEILKEPVFLPCGHTVCKGHEIERRDKNEPIYCRECDENHAIPANGFPISRMAENLLKRKFQNIDLGEEHEKASNACKKLNEFVKKIRQVKHDPESDTHEIVSELKKKIDLRREILKKRIQQIDDEALQLIDEYDELERSSLTNRDKIEEFKRSSKLEELLDKSL